jgi:GT2 family glycosyltransferase
MYGEDVEFCFRAVQKGFRIGIVDKAHIYHKGNVSSQFNSLFYEYHLNRCHLLLCEKLSEDAREQKLSFVVKLISLTMRALLRSFRYRNTNAISGYKQAIFKSTDAALYSSGKTG